MTTLVYTPHYDIGFLGVERLHPFDSRKYGRAWRELRKALGSARLAELHLAVDRKVSDDELLLAHSADYLARMREPKALAAALELPPLKLLPRWLVQWCVVGPMRWAVRGTILAVQTAIRQKSVAVNLSGGYHHAKPEQGEGFCIYSDIAIAVKAARRDGLLPENERVAYIDLDAHQGNGVSHQFADDRRVFLFDMYNSQIYPQYDLKARERIDCDLPLPNGCRDEEYLGILRKSLPGFLDSVGRSQPIGLGIYNAGTDVFAGDRLGGMALSSEAIRQRDRFVIEQFRSRGLPVVMLPSGGYTRESYRLIANGILAILEGHA